MTRFTRRHLVLSLLSLPVAACTASGATHLAPGTTLILTRHADRQGEDLTAQGRARAAALVRALDGIPVDAIYIPGIRRNAETAAPLAAARGLTPIVIPESRAARRLLRGNAGRHVLWVGNKGNLQAIWDDIGAPGAPPLDYGQLAIVTRGPDRAQAVRRLHYGPR